MSGNARCYLLVPRPLGIFEEWLHIKEGHLRDGTSLLKRAIIKIYLYRP